MIQASPNAVRDVTTRALRSPTLPIVIALIIICIVMSILTDRFFTIANITNILAQSGVVGVAAVGATFVVITAGIDLSVGSVIGLAGMLGAMSAAATGNGFVGIAVALATATGIGVFNGLSVAWLNLGPFIVTLATLGMAAGLTLQISQGKAVYDVPDSFAWLGSARIGGVPAAAVFTVVVFIAGHILLTRTTFGHKVYAVGGNREAARLSGIRDRRTLFLVYVFAGLCAGLAAVLLTGRLASATPTAGSGIELQVIAAVVIGGTSLYGGKGSLFGTLIGVLLIGVISNGLTLINVGVFWVQFVQALMIFVAVLLDSLNTRRLNRARRPA
jgi:ribose/xylose/arabinose/galactoside ABC-type transport system permease subunit